MSLNIKKSYTFDDLLLVPQRSKVAPKEVNLQTKLTNNIVLNIPFISSAMDTVTESAMAIAIAREGGIGIIHKNLSIEQQAFEVEKVKRNESGFIYDPITILSNSKIKNAQILMKQYKISGLPVVDKLGKLLGIFTNRDMIVAKSENDIVDDYMTKTNLITSKKSVSLQEAKKILLENRIEKLPIIDQDNNLKGLITKKDIINNEDFPNACKDEKGQLRVGAAISINDDWKQRVEALVNVNVDVIVVDSAHGHSEKVIELVKNVRVCFPKLDIIAGNVVTQQATLDLIEAGANAIKVGVGPGSICTTRVIAGVGVAQLSAINDCYQVCKEKDIAVIADGGIRYSGDVVKALASGANCVMIGSVLASTYESPGEEIVVENKRYKTYMGMGSIKAMEKGSAQRYFQDQDSNKLVAEGVEAKVLLKGSAKDILFQFAGGVKSGMGYCGSGNIKILQQKAQFVEISNAGLIESHPHDISLTKQPANY